MPEIVGRLRPPRLAGAPASPAAGELYHDTGTNALRWWNGTTWASGFPTTAARAYRAAALSLPPGYSKIAVDTTTYDTASMVQLANGRIIVPVSGVYAINGVFSAPMGTPPQTVIAGIYVNGTERSRGERRSTTVSNETADTAVVDFLQLTANDYVELWGYVSVATGCDVSTGPVTNRLSVALLGR